MKLFSKILIALFIVSLLATTCQSKLNDNPHTMNKVITLTGIDNSGNLKLNPPANVKVLVSRGNTVFWIISPNKGIKSIDEIAPKVGSTSIFKAGFPKPLNTSNLQVWYGEIDDQVPVNTEEEYYIKWTDDNGDPQELDPTLKVNQ